MISGYKIQKKILDKYIDVYLCEEQSVDHHLKLDLTTKKLALDMDREEYHVENKLIVWEA